MMMNLDREGRRRLDEYIAQLRQSLGACPSVDPGEVEADVRQHIESELAGGQKPVALHVLEAVLERLGSPTQWVPDERAPTRDAYRSAAEPLGRTIRRALLAAGLALVVSVPLTALGLGVARVAPFFHGSAWRDFVYALRPDVALWLGFVPALIAAAAALAPVSRRRIPLRRTARSAAIAVLGLSVVGAAGYIAIVILDRLILRLHHPTAWIGHLTLMSVRSWFWEALLATVWLVPWILYSHVCHRATAMQTQRRDAERMHLLGLLLWAPVLGIMTFIVSASVGALDLRMVGPGMLGLAITVGVGLSWLMCSKWPAAGSETARAREMWLLRLIGRTVLAVGAGLAPMLLIVWRDFHGLSHADTYIRRIITNGIVFALAGLALGAALAFLRWRQKRLPRTYVVLPLTLASLALLVIAIIRDAQLLHAYKTFRVALLRSHGMAAPAVPALGLLLLLGGMLVIATAALAYAGGQFLPAFLTRERAAHQAGCSQARAGRAST